VADLGLCTPKACRVDCGLAVRVLSVKGWMGTPISGRCKLCCSNLQYQTVFLYWGTLGMGTGKERM
jgi:hypothetical protein